MNDEQRKQIKSHPAFKLYKPGVKNLLLTEMDSPHFPAGSWGVFWSYDQRVYGTLAEALNALAEKKRPWTAEGI